MSRILLVDDDPLLRAAVSRALVARRHTVDEADDGTDALASLEKPGATVDLVLLDLELPRLHGMETLRRIRAADGPPVIVMTALTDAATALEAERLGAERFLVKPLDLEELVATVERVADGVLRGEELSHLRSRSLYHELKGASEPMQRLFKMLSALEGVDVSAVLLTGESGTGKDLVARAIHARGRRHAAPFVEIDCASLPETLFESALFGHERGAFTDAKTTKHGLFEVAATGTVFLDEIGEIPLGSQAKLLRALENRRFKRVGGVTDIPMDAAVVAATNRDLPKLVASGTFREDLYYRLNVFPIVLPPLRDRPEDVVVLAEHFVARLAPRVGRQIVSITDEALRALQSHRWPGNVRELRNVIERALILCQGKEIGLDVLPVEIAGARPVVVPARGFVLPENGIDLEAVERDLVLQALERADGNRTQAGKLLGISRHAMTYRLKQLDVALLRRDDDDDDAGGP